MLKIFLTDLAAYNSGHLRGRFLTLPMEEKELEASIEEILKYGDEYFITDYEFEDVEEMFEVGEYSKPYELNKKISMIEESVEPYQYGALKVLLDNGLAVSLEDAIEKIDDIIVHQDSSMADIAEAYIEEVVDLDALPPLLVGHIDFTGIGRDLEIDGSYFRVGSDIFEFIG